MKMPYLTRYTLKACHHVYCTNVIQFIPENKCQGQMTLSTASIFFLYCICSHRHLVWADTPGSFVKGLEISFDTGGMGKHWSSVNIAKLSWSLFFSLCGHCAISLTSWSQRESRESAEVKPKSLWGGIGFNHSFPFKMTYHASSYITLHMVPENSGILAFIFDAWIRKHHVKSVQGCFNCLIVHLHQSLHKV